MIIKEKTATGYVFENEYGKTFEMTYQEARDLEYLLKIEDVKSDIHSMAEDLDGDVISLGSLDMTIDDFEQEVFDRLNTDVYYDLMTLDDDAINDAIIDVAEEYGILID